MASRSAPRFRRQLVGQLRTNGAIRSDAVEAAFLAVPRERFVPAVVAEHGVEAAYRDEAIVTKRDHRGMPLSSSSQPSLMAMMLELLAPRPGERVLEIGTGTGYNAALLAHMVGEKGRVTTVDIDPEVARSARRALRDSGSRAWVKVGDGRDGFANEAPFDRILVTACADEIPRAWPEQLRDGGSLELPLRFDRDGAAIQLIPVLERHDDRLDSVGLTWGGFMPLHGGDGGWQPPPATLAASRAVKGKSSSLISISGAGLEQLAAGAARELLGSVLAKRTRPRRQGTTEMSTARPPLMLIYLLLRIPAARRVSLRQDGRLGVGMIDRRSRSLAVVSVRWSSDVDTPEGRVRWRLDAYGDDAAAIRLDHLIAGWQELRREHRTRLEMTAGVDADPLRLAFAWSRA